MMNLKESGNLLKSNCSSLCLMLRYFFLGKGIGIVFYFLPPNKIVNAASTFIFTALTIILIIISSALFKHIKFYGLSKHYYLKTKNPDEEISFWESLKRASQY
jgi:hypothetical protein